MAQFFSHFPGEIIQNHFINIIDYTFKELTKRAILLKKTQQKDKITQNNCFEWFSIESRKTKMKPMTCQSYH